MRKISIKNIVLILILLGATFDAGSAFSQFYNNSFRVNLNYDGSFMPLEKLGWWPDNTKVEDNYFMDDEADFNQILDYMSHIETSYSSSEMGMSKSEFVDKLVVVSECFEISPSMFTGLIKTESAFRRSAVSATGAKGLTQMTTAGINEVNDQLGFRGEGFADKKNTEYFRDKIKTCIEPHLLKGRKWVDLWKRAGVGRSVSKMKNEMFKVNEALVYGAIQLKTLLAVHAPMTLNSNSLKTAHYRKALEAYNGEPGLRKVRYATKILRLSEVIRHFSSMRGGTRKTLPFGFKDLKKT